MRPEKYLHKGYIVPDMRLQVDFHLTLVKGMTKKTRKVSTRADTIAKARGLVEQVAADLVREEGWDCYQLEAVG